MVIFHNFSAQRSSLLTLIFFTTFSWAAVLPPGETLDDAINDGRTPSCGGAEFGSPFLQTCNLAISTFLATILARGFDLHQTIEFLDIDTVSLFADKYPRQPLTEAGDYHTFSTKLKYNFGSQQEGCILRFFMFEAPDSNPSERASSVSTYNSFFSAARLLAGVCVQTEGKGGFMRVRGEGRHIGVSLEEWKQDDSEVDLQLAVTKNYRPNPIDITLITYQVDLQEAAEAPAMVGDPGQGSSNYQDTTLWPTYCDTQQIPSTCEGGGSCSPEQSQRDEEGEERTRLMWGQAIADLLGRCPGGSMI
ncbi:MAG: hypothetical protein M1812_003409 [Candelaria pacifica]|nr:MAG: hypothetical protein M1812_003409 [Candelaria pacifica]